VSNFYIHNHAKTQLACWISLFALLKKLAAVMQVGLWMILMGQITAKANVPQGNKAK